jgi:hypothetical protein
MERITKRFGFAAVVLLVVVGVAGRAPAGTIIVDEFGNGVGTVGGGFLSSLDTGPGALPNVLTYVLPFAGTQGDVFLQSPESGLPSDVIRFDGNFHLFFYSGVDTISDNQNVHDVGLPTAFSTTNNISTPETGPEGQNMAIYTPVLQPQGIFNPGFDASHPTYIIFSDGLAVPEPSSLALLGWGAVCIAYGLARKHRQSLTGRSRGRCKNRRASEGEVGRS